MRRYFAFCDDESVVPLGRFEDIEGAFEVSDNLPYKHCLWVMDVEGLENIIRSAADALAS